MYQPSAVVIRNSNGTPYRMILGQRLGTLVAQLRFCQLGMSGSFSYTNMGSGTTQIYLVDSHNNVLDIPSQSLANSRISPNGDCVSMHAQMVNLTGDISFMSIRVVFTPNVVAKCPAGLYPTRSGISFNCVNKTLETGTRVYGPVTPLTDSVAVFAAASLAFGDRLLVLGDSEYPTIVGCPGDMLVNVTEFSPNISVSWVIPLAVDNVGIASSSPSEFVAERAGTIFVYNVPFVNRISRYVYGAFDFSGNPAYCR